MRNEYNYYIRIIKPIEKKYNRMCILYSIFKLKWFEEKKKKYNIILINYYKMLQNDTNYTSNLENSFYQKK